jgi:DNA replication ATP-dependent helicase Dna2
VPLLVYEPLTDARKLLRVQEHKTDKTKFVSLRESWWDTYCPVGAFVHVIATFDHSDRCVVDNAHGLLIVHPDYLLSATVVADAYKCTRRAVLQDRVKATSEVNESQIYGHILHEIFQEALQANRWDLEWFQITVKTVASRYLEGLFELNIGVEMAFERLMGRVPELQHWAQLFVNAKQQPGAFVKGPKEEVTPVAITKLLDVEEHVWSPLYGLKGNIDATVQITVEQHGSIQKLTVPLEVKTGRKRENEPNISHNSQTALYTLLLSDRYDIEIAFGILYYLETSEMARISGLRHEIVGMLQRRNELASFIRDRKELPPMLKNQHTCGHCYAQTSCYVYHKLVEDGDGKTSGLGQKFNDAMQHLQPIHADFFKKWDALLTKEEGDVLKFRKELWTMTSSEREKIGRCFGGIVLKAGSATTNQNASKINRFEYIFTKPGAPSCFSFSESQINLGEPIVISDEQGHYALANGYVTKIRKHEIAVAVDRRLHNARVKSKEFDAQSNQSFTGIMEVKDIEGFSSMSIPREPQEVVRYRLDKDEFSNGMATVRNNLIRVMEKELFGARFLRRLVIEDVAPVYVAPPSTLKTHLEQNKGELNVDQQNAISKVMEAQDYALVLGMPGTGKTTTIAHIIRALAATGKSVLLTSYTHTAVDNILLKIRNDNLSILRIGAETKIHPEVREFADLASTPKATFEEVERTYKSQVVATTCLGINHPIFNQRTFDYCIVDEASQITLPVCLGPIRMAQRFVLVGDHYQLPPLVQNKEAQEGGLDISLFKLLSDRHPESVVNLEHQYRMNEDIMSLSNTLIYNGRLKCGTQAVARRSLKIPNLDGLRQHHHTLDTLSGSESSICMAPRSGSCWLNVVLAPARHVTFLNTDLMDTRAREIAHGSRVTNPTEVIITTQLVRALLAIGIDATDVGVITLYRSQLSLLKQAMRVQGGSHNNDINTNAAAAVEMHTADKFQGRDKEIVVLSLVRSNENNNIGDLLQDWRRVNVALTRARTKLIIVGSFGTISKGNELLRKFCTLIDQQGWRYDLKPTALEEHHFEEMTTQLSGLVQSQHEVKVEAKAEQRGGHLSDSKDVAAKTKIPGKTGSVDPVRLLKTRPILRDVMNEVLA